MPIIHVNADDVEACVSAVRLAHAYRETFARDALIDLIGYRRFGHNETDEPAYTQPQMYAKIKTHPPVRKLYADRLVADGVVTQEEAERMAGEAYERVAPGPRRAEGVDRRAARHRRARARPHDEPRAAHDRAGGHAAVARRAAPATSPRASTCTASSSPLLERRREALAEGGPIDWAHAESLAIGSLLALGVPVRLTGQDSERGTFSQRHAVLHDAKTGDRYSPLQHLRDANAPFELHNSPLSEQACMGFEYGYSVQAPDALVLWEAQFGDFVNSAQVIIDQFLVSGLAKWGQTSRLTLLLPHGYEGSGPEHSSGRVERFLQAAAEGNIRVANCTTPAQYFHLLRRQALVSKPRPLIVMTPKSLLRLPEASSRLEELSDGHFERVIDDPRFADGGREQVTKLVLCSGKIYYDIAGHDERDAAVPHRDRARGAALSVPRGGPREADRELPEPRARRVGAGGAAQHGPARVHAPPHGEDPPGAHVLRLRRPPAARRHRRGLLGRAQARAGAHRARGAGPRGRPPRAGQLSSAPGDVAARRARARWRAPLSTSVMTALPTHHWQIASILNTSAQVR